MNPQFADKCNARWNRNLPPHAASILHATTGILLEVREFRKAVTEVNKLEEFGDVLYFAHTIWHDIGRPELDTAGEVTAGCLEDAVVKLAEQAKRYAVYWTPEKDAHLRKCVTEALADLNRGLLKHFGDQLEPAMEANDRKLTARYGGATFVAEKATERDLGAEMEALTGGSVPQEVNHGILEGVPKNIIPILYKRVCELEARPNPGSGDGSDDLADHNAAQADEGH